ncbi:solute carrier family 41 member 1 [Lentinula edodes]|uniref:solute carrier family 41 member 1 n=1 Tax=Lentinula edodes TaxID=5353 RepID=UPI001E8DA943|nr:solute carrier family 41 member 1 [Lentinula edodes]KAH7880070.1 solute carrier family 41 member 1 [Lentinula edodes]
MNGVELNALRNGNQQSPVLESGLKSSFINDGHDDEDAFSENGDDEEALLSTSYEHRRNDRSVVKAGRWPQVKDIVIEAAPTLLFTTIGLLFTGELLDHVSRWRAMREVDQLIMIIPVILNLKGNLEMNLSARLGTAANVGELDDPHIMRKIIFGNLSLLQVQATVVSFVAACVSFVLGFIIPRAEIPATQPSESTLATRQLLGLLPRRPRPTLPPVDTSRKFGIHSFFMVVSTAMSAACLSSLILGSFMCTLIVICKRYGRNPDNIAPPIASCLGDLVTLLLIGVVSTLLIPFLNGFIPILVVIVVLLSFLFSFAATYRNLYVKDLIKQGWVPLFGAMIISSTTGIVLDLFVSRYEGFALLAVVISGLPGSVGSIFISRLSTTLHAVALSAAPSGTFRPSKNSAEPSSNLVMIVLILITIPVEIIFLSVLHGLGWLHPPFLFIAFSVVFFCCAASHLLSLSTVTASLFIARSLTHFLWSRNLDPDTYALPIHSALMDLIGQLLLVLCFEIVTLLGAVPHTKATSEAN